MSAPVAWQPGDVSPEAQRAAEAAAAKAGVPLGEWLAETVRSAILRELGSLPAEPRAPEPAKPPLPTGPVTTLAVAGLRSASIRSRRLADPDPAISGLAAAIVIEGVREPILVRRLPGQVGSYEVVAGERRRLAAERAGRADLPAVVIEADDAETLMHSLAENLGRDDFSPLDEGRAYLRLLTEFRVSPAVLAARVARERSHIVMALRLLGLPEAVRRMIDSGRLTPVQAYALLSAPDPVAAAEQIIAGVSPDPVPDPG